MKWLTVLTYPDPRLRLVAAPVSEASKELEELATNMFRILYERHGYGLAATQVDVQKRLLVMDISNNRSDPRIYVNPEIVETEGRVSTKEGCFSVPNFEAMVPRAKRIKIKARKIGFEPFEEELGGQAAVCMQHEIDHLDGKLFIDYLPRQRQRSYRRRLLKLRKQGLV